MNRISKQRPVATALLASIVAFLLALPTVAGASPGAVIQDCAEDGDLDGSYSNEDKRAAANSLPADLAEYSDCGEVINGSITSANSAGNGGGDSGGGGATSNGGSPVASKRRGAQRKKGKRSKKAKERKRKTALAAAPAGADNDGLFETAKASDGMPTPLLLALILGAALSAAGGLVLLHKRRPELAQNVLSRVPLRRFRG